MLPGNDGFQAVERYALLLHNLLKCGVENLDSTARNNSSCNFGPLWQGKFSDQEDVYRVMKVLGNFTRDGDAPAGKC